MMRIKFTTAIAGERYSYSPGNVVDWRDDKEAKRLIDAGFAVPVKDGEVLEHTVLPPPRETATALPKPAAAPPKPTGDAAAEPTPASAAASDPDPKAAEMADKPDADDKGEKPKGEKPKGGKGK